jgi:hypothetical protein
VTLSIEIEYLKQDNVWERVNCCRMSITLACGKQSQHFAAKFAAVATGVLKNAPGSRTSVPSL